MGADIWYAATEKLEIVRLVEQNLALVRRTLHQIVTFYAWYIAL
jgi:hypothetical protein